MSDVVFWSGFNVAHPVKKTALADLMQRPIACYQLSWWLRKHRFTTQVVEFINMLSVAELIELSAPFIDDKTLCIAISTTFWSQIYTVPDNLLEALAYFKTRFPKLKVIVGGAHSRQLTKSPVVDIILHGDGEGSLLTWCQEAKRGVAFPNASFDITTLDHRFRLEDVILPEEMLPIELGRGCIFRCKFCGFDKIGKTKNTYQRQHSKIVQEMAHNYEMFGTTNYVFLDDTVNEDYDKIVRLSTLSTELGFQPRWVGYLRADLIWSKPETASLLEQSGLISSFHGIESLHPGASTAIGKGWSGKKAKDWLPHLHSDLWGSRINMTCSYILGLPKEPIKSFFETFNWCKENLFGRHLFFPLYLRFDEQSSAPDASEFSKNSAKYGYIEDPKNAGSWKSPITNYTMCNILADKFNDEMTPLSRISSFRFIQTVNSGLSITEAANAKPAEANARVLGQAAAFKQRYIAQFKKVFNLE